MYFSFMADHFCVWVSASKLTIFHFNSWLTSQQSTSSFTAWQVNNLTNRQSMRTTDRCSWSSSVSRTRNDTRTRSYADKHASISSLSWRWQAVRDVMMTSRRCRWDEAGAPRSRLLAAMTASVNRRRHGRPPIALSVAVRSTTTSIADGGLRHYRRSRVAHCYGTNAVEQAVAARRSTNAILRA